MANKNNVCDACGFPLRGLRHFTLNIRKVDDGKQTVHPAVCLCPLCFRGTNIAPLLRDGVEVLKDG